MLFTKTELEELQRKTQEPGRIPSRNQIVDRVIPLAPVAARKQPVKYTLDDPQPMAEPEALAKTESVAPVLKKRKKIVRTDFNTGEVTVEYVDADAGAGVRRSE